jgi:hypothetical protein
MMATSARDDAPHGHETHVVRLIKKYAAGRSYREIDRENGWRDYIARYARGDWDTRKLNLDVIDKLAKALGTTREEVSEAFALDMEFPINGRQLKVDHVDLVESYDALSEEGRIALMAVTQALREKFPATPSPEAAC